MKYCKSCSVHSFDDSKRCVLCGSMMEVSDDGPTHHRYPEYVIKRSEFSFIKKMYIYLSIIIVITSIAVDIWRESLISWSLLSVSVVLYSWTIIYHAIKNNVHIASKILVQAISGAIFILLIDIFFGYEGWSVNYVIPQVFMVANVVIFILMMINRMSWRDYVFYQLVMTLLGLVPMFFMLFGWITRPLMSVSSFVLSLAILLGTFIFGDKTVKGELIRRFHL